MAATDPPRFETRSAGLEWAAGRLIDGSRWLRENPEHADVRRVRSALGRIRAWARGLALAADDRDRADADFVRLARLLFPCPRCEGRGTKFAGRCFKCAGLGYHLDREARRGR